MLLHQIEKPIVRKWYAQQTIQNGWSRSVLEIQIESRLYERQGIPKQKVNNYHKIIAEYALQNMQAPIGIAGYQLAKSLSQALKTNLPSTEQIESELNEALESKAKIINGM